MALLPLCPETPDLSAAPLAAKAGLEQFRPIALSDFLFCVEILYMLQAYRLKAFFLGNHPSLRCAGC